MDRISSVMFHIACIAAYTEEGVGKGGAATYASSLKAFKIPRKQGVSALIQSSIISMVPIRDISAS